MNEYKNYFYWYNYIKSVKWLIWVWDLWSKFNEFIKLNKDKYKNITINEDDKIYITKNIDWEVFEFHLDFTNGNLWDALILWIYMYSKCLDCWEEDFDLTETPLLKIKKEDLEWQNEFGLFMKIQFFLPNSYFFGWFKEWEHYWEYNEKILELKKKEEDLLNIINDRKNNPEWQLLNDKKILRNNIHNEKIKDNYESLFKEELEIIKNSFEEYLKTLGIECWFSDIWYTELVDLV